MQGNWFKPRLSECVQTACVLLFLEWIGEEKTKPTSCKSITLSNRHKILDIFLSFTNKKDNIQDNCWPDIEPSLQMFLHILGFIVANLQRRCLRMTSALLEKLSGNHHLKNSELYHMQCESLYVAKLRSPWWCLSRWIIIRSNCLIENSDRLPLTVRVHTCNLCIFWGVGHCKIGGRTSKQEWQSTPGTEAEEQQLIPVYSTCWLCCWKTFHIIYQILLFYISFMLVHLIFS